MFSTRCVSYILSPLLNLHPIILHFRFVSISYSQSTSMSLLYLFEIPFSFFFISRVVCDVSLLIFFLKLSDGSNLNHFSCVLISFFFSNFFFPPFPSLLSPETAFHYSILTLHSLFISTSFDSKSVSAFRRPEYNFESGTF